jgi:hypothetical protein
MEKAPKRNLAISTLKTFRGVKNPDDALFRLLAVKERVQGKAKTVGAASLYVDFNDFIALRRVKR